MKTRHPLDVPEGTMFSNLLSAASVPTREALEKAIESLDELLEDRTSVRLVRKKQP